MSNYPTSLDNFPTTRADGTASATTHASDHNEANDAINKMQQEMGTIPGWGPTPRTQPAGRGLLQTAAKLENMPRWGVVQSALATTTLVSGTIRVTPLGVLRANETVSSIAFAASTAGATYTAIWGGIARLSDRVVLARSNNSTTANTANSMRVLTFSAAYTPTADETVVGFLMVSATTQPSWLGITQAATFMLDTPTINGTSNTGQTATPIGVGATMTAFTAATAVLYAQLR